MSPLRDPNMRAAVALALSATLLAACQPMGVEEAGNGFDIPPGEVRVAAVEARGSRVTMRMSNGDRCVGLRPEGTQSGWSGVTQDCGFALPYDVTFKQGGAPMRFTIEDPSGAMAPDGTLRPRAEVYVTDVDGIRRLFIAALGPGTRLTTAPVES